MNDSYTYLFYWNSYLIRITAELDDLDTVCQGRQTKINSML